jgi:hypothetical protein
MITPPCDHIGNVKIIVALRAILINKLPFVNLPFERGKILFSKGFSIYTDIRKLQDKTKTSWMTTICTSGIAAILYASLLKNANL